MERMAEAGGDWCKWTTPPPLSRSSHPLSFAPSSLILQPARPARAPHVQSTCRDSSPERTLACLGLGAGLVAGLTDNLSLPDKNASLRQASRPSSRASPCQTRPTAKTAAAAAAAATQISPQVSRVE